VGGTAELAGALLALRYIARESGDPGADSSAAGTLSLSRSVGES